ncbi:MAG TPA: hypothetical protein VEW69_02265 [Alphaproteobacteria bacterium]|nr:hypothetical protein [Alphaproteobacteria bacterium]
MSTSPTPVPPAAGVAAKKSNIWLWVLGGCGTLIVLVIVVLGLLGLFVWNKAKQAGIDPALMKKNPALATFKMAISMNPDVQMISSDDDAGTMVVRDKKTGKTVTMKFDPDKKTMTMTDENGKTGTVRIDPATKRMVITDDTGKEATITASESGVEVKGSEGSTLKMGASADKPPAWVPAYPGSSPQSTMSATETNRQTGTFVFATNDASDKVMAFYADALKSAGFTASTTSNNTNGKVSGMVNGADKDDKRSVIVIVSAEQDGTHVSVSFTEQK